MGIISTDLKPYYSEDRTDRIRTIGGPPVKRLLLPQLSVSKTFPQVDHLAVMNFLLSGGDTKQFKVPAPSSSGMLMTKKS